jgi:hypothetical protein
LYDDRRNLLLYDTHRTTKDALMTRSRSTAAVVAQYILELAEPRPASGAREGAIGVIPNGALEPQPGSS